MLARVLIFSLDSRGITRTSSGKRAGKPRYGNHAGPVIEFDDVQARFLPVDELDREEVKLILLHLPEFNMHHNYVPKDLTHIPAFRELLLKAKASGRFTTVDRMPFGLHHSAYAKTASAIAPNGEVLMKTVADPAFVRFRESHHAIARMFAAGWTISKVFPRDGYTRRRFAYPFD